MVAEYLFSAHQKKMQQSLTVFNGSDFISQSSAANYMQNNRVQKLRKSKTRYGKKSQW